MGVGSCQETPTRSDALKFLIGMVIHCMFVGANDDRSMCVRMVVSRPINDKFNNNPEILGDF